MIDGYDFIHFHTTIELYQQKHILDKFKGKVILTSHSPVPAFKEILEELSKTEKFIFRRLYSKLEAIDIYAFQKADYLLFPCKEAEEAYYKHWNKYRQIHKENKSKYKYILTGIQPCIANRAESDVKKELDIDESAFIISYIGRHNSVKGYDVLRNIGKSILKNSYNIKFVICGKEEPIKGIDNPNWIEIGWTNDAYSYMNASNVFILPNRETYFDIVMLEALSLGKIIIASETGGNKVFKNKSKGIFLYKCEEEAISHINRIKNMNKEEIAYLEESNRTLFKNEFSTEVFLKIILNY
jgi:glycosyltransferase involved in cell wall biosynthesis